MRILNRLVWLIPIFIGVNVANVSASTLDELVAARERSKEAQGQGIKKTYGQPLNVDAATRSRMESEAGQRNRTGSADIRKFRLKTNQVLEGVVEYESWDSYVVKMRDGTRVKIYKSALAAPVS